MTWPPPPTDPPLSVPAEARELAGLQPGRILCIRLERLGDVLLTTPSLRALRQRYPRARIEMLSGRAALPLLEGNPHVDAVHAVVGTRHGLRFARGLSADLVVDLQRSSRSSMLARAISAPVRLGRPAGRWHDRLLSHRVPAQRAYSAHFQASILRVLGIEDLCLDLQLPPTPELDRRVNEQARTLAPGRRIGLAPGARARTRQLPESSWAALAQQLDQAGYRPLILWGPAEEQLASRLAEQGPAVAAPPTGLLEMGAWISTCEAMISACSLARHLAVARRVPSLTAHGASSVGGWTRPTRWHRALWTELPCRPCHSTRCDIQVKCLAELRPESFMQRLDDILGLGPEPALHVRIQP